MQKGSLLKQKQVCFNVLNLIQSNCDCQHLKHNLYKCKLCKLTLFNFVFDQDAVFNIISLLLQLFH